MNANPLKQGVLTENGAGIGTVTKQMVRDRAPELAGIDGRSAQDVSRTDLDQAKRELTGRSDADSKTAELESAPEAERWDPLPGSAGQKISTAQSEDEDSEGRSDNELLTEEGIAGAEHDQMLRASKSDAEQA